MLIRRYSNIYEFVRKSTEPAGEGESMNERRALILLALTLCSQLRTLPLAGHALTGGRNRRLAERRLQVATSDDNVPKLQIKADGISLRELSLTGGTDGR